MDVAGGDGEREVRASDADRAEVIARLRDAVGEGAIDLDELEARVGAAYGARTVGELVPLTADLPVPASGAVPPAPTGSRVPVPSIPDHLPFRIHLSVYGAVMLLLIGVWALSGGGFFWPFFPAAGWGIGLAAHGQVAAASVRRRRARLAPAAPTTPRPAIAPRGQGPAPSAPPGRRFVVAMFVDVVDSTRLNEALGDEQWATVRRRFRSAVGAAAAAEGGWEANTTGDGVLVRFEHPAAAARAAVALLRRLEGERVETGFAPSVRVGIHSGDAVDEGADIIGVVVNLAARVTAAAGTDEIYVTEHVADHLDGELEAPGRGLQSLKGVERPRHLLEVAWR